MTSSTSNPHPRNPSLFQPPPPAPPATFEFTKRKRWADLLVTELADANLFILSSNFRIMYCGGAVTELLGWREVDIVDHDFGDIISSDDQNHFRSCFDDSIHRSSELITYVRLRCNAPAATYPYSPVKEVLFEIKGYPKYVKYSLGQGQDYSGVGGGEQLFFALAKPYLSRNTVMLNTVLELQLEHEHLQRKLRMLKMQCSANVYPPLLGLQQRSGSIEFSTGLDKGLGVVGGRSSISFDASSSADVGSSGGAGGDDQQPEDGGKKKKLKKSHTAEHYVCVTCGRTDSPEWRKGPLGPKTLCNACGLRWAKQQRKTDDAGAGGGVGAGDSGGGD
uniref:White collar photoreceptors-like protein n=1 Tax=Moniliophthora roreri TaxID=221103 RepID=A0A0W0G3V0_MONRR